MKRRGISQVAIGVAIASYSLGYILGAVLPSQALYSFLCPWKTAQSVYSFLALLYFLRYQLLYPDRYPNLFFQLENVVLEQSSVFKDQ